MGNNTTSPRLKNDELAESASLSNDRNENDKLLDALTQEAILGSEQCKGTRDNYIYAFGVEEIDDEEE
ncbi:MAG: hypothetical protein OCD76_12525 [Reichenbachiella sp.]